MRVSWILFLLMMFVFTWVFFHFEWDLFGFFLPYWRLACMHLSLLACCVVIAHFKCFFFDVVNLCYAFPNASRCYFLWVIWNFPERLKCAVHRISRNFRSKCVCVCVSLDKSVWLHFIIHVQHEQRMMKIRHKAFSNAFDAIIICIHKFDSITCCGCGYTFWVHELDRCCILNSLECFIVSEWVNKNTYCPCLFYHSHTI